MFWEPQQQQHGQLYVHENLYVPWLVPVGLYIQIICSNWHLHCSDLIATFSSKSKNIRFYKFFWLFTVQTKFFSKTKKKTISQIKYQSNKMTQDFSWIFYNFKADKTRIVSVPEQVQVRNTYKTPWSTNNLSSSFGLTE